MYRDEVQEDVARGRELRVEEAPVADGLLEPALGHVGKRAEHALQRAENAERDAGAGGLDAPARRAEARQDLVELARQLACEHRRRRADDGRERPLDLARPGPAHRPRRHLLHDDARGRGRRRGRGGTTCGRRRRSRCGLALDPS
jgi:hypothetical protein